MHLTVPVAIAQAALSLHTMLTIIMAGMDNILAVLDLNVEVIGIGEPSFVSRNLMSLDMHQ